MPSNTRQLVQKGAGPGGADIYVDPAGILAVAMDQERMKLLQELHQQAALYHEVAKLVEGMFGQLRFLSEITDIENHYAKLHKALAEYSAVHALNHDAVAGALLAIGSYFEQVDGA